MIYGVTYIDIRPAATDEGAELLRRYRDAQPGGAGIQTLQEIARQNRFLLMEAWNDEAAYEAYEAAAGVTTLRERLRSIHNSPYDQRVHQEFSVDPDPLGPRPGDLAIATHVDVPPPRREQTEALLRRLAEASRKDESNLRYDIFQQKAPRTNHFTIFAVWESQAGFDLHQAARHTQEFREALGPMLGAPYDERLYHALA